MHKRVFFWTFLADWFQAQKEIHPALEALKFISQNGKKKKKKGGGHFECETSLQLFLL